MKRVSESHSNAWVHTCTHTDTYTLYRLCSSVWQQQQRQQQTRIVKVTSSSLMSPWSCLRQRVSLLQTSSSPFSCSLSPHLPRSLRLCAALLLLLMIPFSPLLLSSLSFPLSHAVSMPPSLLPPSILDMLSSPLPSSFSRSPLLCWLFHLCCCSEYACCRNQTVSNLVHLSHHIHINNDTSSLFRTSFLPPNFSFCSSVKRIIGEG